LTSGRRPVAKTIAESLSQHDEKHVVPTPLSGEKGEEEEEFGSYSSRLQLSLNFLDELGIS
jgi:hypothetical protein